MRILPRKPCPCKSPQQCVSRVPVNHHSNLVEPDCRVAVAVEALANNDKSELSSPRSCHTWYLSASTAIVSFRISRSRPPRRSPFLSTVPFKGLKSALLAAGFNGCQYVLWPKSARSRSPPRAVAPHAVFGSRSQTAPSSRFLRWLPPCAQDL